MQNKNIAISLGLVIALVVAFVFACMGISNHAISLEQSVYRSQGDINAQLTRRAQLVPDLVATIKQSSNYERDTQMDVISLRSAGDTDGSYQAGTAISLVAEAYPDLKANENYKSLMQELSVTENLIFQYRSAYNESAKSYTTFISQQPFGIVLDLFGYEKKDISYTTDLSNGEYSKPGDLFENKN